MVSKARNPESQMLFYYMEIWKVPLPELKNFCEVSNLGRIKHLARTVVDKRGFYKNYKEVVSKNVTNTTGKYLIISSSGSFGKSRQFYIHRLVALAFIPNPNNLPTVNHINGVKSDNRVENLEWCTYSENNQHAFDTKLKSYNHLTMSKLTSQDVLNIRKDIENKLKPNKIAAKYGVTVHTIYCIRVGKTWSHLI